MAYIGIKWIVYIWTGVVFICFDFEMHIFSEQN